MIPPYKPPSILSFLVTLENVGEKDRILNLGYFNANGRRQIPDAIVFFLTDSSEQSKEGHVFYWSISMRLDDYVVPLRAGSLYSLIINMDQILWAGDQVPKPGLNSGDYHIRAEFRGTGAGHTSLDDSTSLMKFWMGVLRSEETAFSIG